MAEMVEGKEVRCIQVGGGTPCDGRSRPTNRDRIVAQCFVGDRPPPTPIPLPSISGRFALEASAQTRGFFDSSLLAGVRKLFFILTEIKLD